MISLVLINYSFSQQGTYTMTSDMPIKMTSLGSGTYNTTVFYHNLYNGLTIDLAKTTDNINATPIDFNINARGQNPFFTIKGTTGNVGIGTITPQAKLDIAGTLRSVSHTISDYSPVLFLDRNVNNGGYVQGVQTRLSDGTKNWFFGNLHGDTFLITTGDYTGPQQFVINRNGNAALKGKFEAKEIKVTLTPTADFVFENDYTLPKLENVEKYVKEEKHLPEIASAKEMVKEGVNVGEFQIKLLQKIEELTLYVIQLNKDVKKLEEENKQLKQKGILTE